LALRAAHESIVLLKNEGNILPLDINSEKLVIGVIGPNANASETLLGYFSLDLLSPLYWSVCLTFLGSGKLRNYHGNPPFIVNPLDALQQAADERNWIVQYAMGCEIDSNDTR
jgi:beta-glucosidase-like glycosyl hydrolase